MEWLVIQYLKKKNKKLKIILINLHNINFKINYYLNNNNIKNIRIMKYTYNIFLYQHIDHPCSEFFFY